MLTLVETNFRYEIKQTLQIRDIRASSCASKSHDKEAAGPCSEIEPR